MKFQLIATVSLITVLQACTWVKPTEAGANVVVGQASNVRTCKHISAITTSVKNQVGSMPRKPAKVSEELTTLAKNEAAIRGGDTIVAKAPASGGSMTFDVYQCAG